jgi:chromate transporter
LGDRTSAPLRGVNAAVVGILLAALYQPVYLRHHQRQRFRARGCRFFLLLFMWKTPPWLVVAFCALRWVGVDTRGVTQVTCRQP